MSESKKKCRQYNAEYLKHGFVVSPGNMKAQMCLLCERKFSNESMRPCMMVKHLHNIHPDKANKNLAYFQSLHERFLRRPKLDRSLPSTSRTQEHDGLLASYNISLLIAKSGKAHTIGEELLIPVISEVLNTVLHVPAADVIKKVSLSNDTVQRRIDDMAADVEQTLCEFLKTTQFSLQLDESILPGNEALLLAYVRFIKAEQVVQEMLFAKELVTDTRGESIFLVLKDFFEEKEIPLSNITAVATDGAPAMTGRQRGFIAHLKQIVPDIVAVHCVIHREHLAAKRLSNRLNSLLRLVINAISKIKSNPLNDRLFRQLCEESDAEYSRLLLHTKVRWLSKGTCLTRFYCLFELFEAVVEFFASYDNALCENLKKRESDIAYLADLYFKFNEMNLLLQGNELNRITTKAAVCGFVRKLPLLRRNLARRELGQFPNLCALQVNVEIKDDDVEAYCQHLDMLHHDLSARYEDILGMEVPSWVIDSFSAADAAELELQQGWGTSGPRDHFPPTRWGNHARMRDSVKCDCGKLFFIMR
ncbi:hypothetical protein TTRE_0000953001 [Trichuris trichiura]|uniref:SCAN domain-containing protein 3 n=1 Tax=Trichuris trichiura TaxID=36087 RepID=A0A077ZLA7_TRITR|nr:hypothetical protein TTRE_0000953001 [Trichuris trichiura]